MDYETAKTAFATCRNPEAGKPLAGKATRLVRTPGGDLAVRYHETNVVTFHPCGAITLATGGYNTKTTRAKINQYAPVHCWTRRNDAYITVGGQDYPLFDTFRLDPAGQPIDAKTERPDREKLRNQLDRACRAYVKGFCDWIATEGPRCESGLPDTGGDCWLCMFSSPTATTSSYFGFGARSVRVSPSDGDHIASHIAERYYMTSLLYRAVQETYSHPDTVMATIALYAKQGRCDSLVKHTLARYLRRRKTAILDGGFSFSTPE